jgi:hypothetical protein
MPCPGLPGHRRRWRFAGRGMERPLHGNLYGCSAVGGLLGEAQRVVICMGLPPDPVEKIPTAWEHPSIASTFYIVAAHTVN